MTEVNLRKQSGQQAEWLAATFLHDQGMRLLDRNYNCRFGEIDLILLHDKTLVFAEVRYRKSSRYGTPAESVVKQKQKRLITTARHYLARNPAMSRYPARFDIVAIGPNLCREHIQWLENAFVAF